MCKLFKLKDMTTILLRANKEAIRTECDYLLPVGHRIVYDRTHYLIIESKYDFDLNRQFCNLVEA